MTQRKPATSAPGPLEAYSQHFDALFARHNQRDVFRHYLAGLLLPTERNKTLTALATTEPIVGAHHPGQPDRGRALVQSAHVGRAELSTGGARVGLGALPGSLGSGDPAALAVGVLRVLLLLVAPQPGG